MKKWNWTMGGIVFAICLLGSMANNNYETIGISLIFGLIFGIPFSLFSAWVFK